jgi:hypothetical protein
VLSNGAGAQTSIKSPGGTAALVLHRDGLLETISLEDGRRLALLSGTVIQCKQPLRWEGGGGARS